MTQKELREQNRAAVIRAAQGRFLAQSIDKTTIAEIAEDADLTPMSVYRYFGSKQAIAVAVANHLLDAYLADALGVDQDAREELRRKFVWHRPGKAPGLATQAHELAAVGDAHPLSPRLFSRPSPLSANPSGAQGYTERNDHWEFRISRVIDVEIFAQQYPSKIVPRTPAIDIAMATPHII